MELKLLSLIVQLVQNYMTSSPNGENFNTCKHSIYCPFCMELDLLMQFIALHLMWDTSWIPTWMKYRVSRVSEYIYMCVCVCVYLWFKIVSNKCHIWMVTFIVYCKPKSTLNQLKFINANYDTYYEKYLLKSKFMKLSNFAWFIDLFMTSFNQRYPLRYHIFLHLIGIAW